MSGSPEKPLMLYVEDDDTAVFLLQTALKEVNIEVEMFRVHDGEEAMAWIRQSGLFSSAPRPNLILLDLNLPRKSGLEVLAEIHNDTSLRSIPVIVFSSSFLETDRRRSLQLGAHSYIRKPLTFPAFVEAVRSACTLLEK